MADRRIFQKIDPWIDDDQAIHQAGYMAEWLYIRGLLYIRRNIHGHHPRDGIIPKTAISEVTAGVPNPARNIKALIDVGLWIDAGDRWEIKGWSTWNQDTETRKAISAKRRESGRLGGHRAKHDVKHPGEDCDYCREEGWT